MGWFLFALILGLLTGHSEGAHFRVVSEKRIQLNSIHHIFNRWKESDPKPADRLGERFPEFVEVGFSDYGGTRFSKYIQHCDGVPFRGTGVVVWHNEHFSRSVLGKVLEEPRCPDVSRLTDDGFTSFARLHPRFELLSDPQPGFAPIGTPRLNTDSFPPDPGQFPARPPVFPARPPARNPLEVQAEDAEGSPDRSPTGENGEARPSTNTFQLVHTAKARFVDSRGRMQYGVVCVRPDGVACGFESLIRHAQVVKEVYKYPTICTDDMNAVLPGVPLLAGDDNATYAEEADSVSDEIIGDAEDAFTNLSIVVDAFLHGFNRSSYDDHGSDVIATIEATVPDEEASDSDISNVDTTKLESDIGPTTAESEATVAARRRTALDHRLRRVSTCSGGNAFWISDAESPQMVFLTDSSTFVDFESSLEVVAHEFMHGVIDETSKLVYRGESGAIAEGMCDAIGVGVRIWHLSGGSSEGNPIRMRTAFPELDNITNVYWIGENSIAPDTGYAALRYMDDPARDGVSAQHFSELKTCDCMDMPLDYPDGDCTMWCDLENDSSFVHANSGIFNLFVYLLAEGGSHPRLGGPSLDAGIGISRTLRLLDHLNMHLLYPDVSYTELRDLMRAAAEALFNPGGDTTRRVPFMGPSVDSSRSNMHQSLDEFVFVDYTINIAADIVGLPGTHDYEVPSSDDGKSGGFGGGGFFPVVGVVLLGFVALLIFFIQHLRRPKANTSVSIIKDAAVLNGTAMSPAMAADKRKPEDDGRLAEFEAAATRRSMIPLASATASPAEPKDVNTAVPNTLAVPSSYATSSHVGGGKASDPSKPTHQSEAGSPPSVVNTGKADSGLVGIAATAPGTGGPAGPFGGNNGTAISSIDVCSPDKLRQTSKDISSHASSGSRSNRCSSSTPTRSRTADSLLPKMIVEEPLRSKTMENFTLTLDDEVADDGGSTLTVRGSELPTLTPSAESTSTPKFRFRSRSRSFSGGAMAPPSRRSAGSGTHYGGSPHSLPHDMDPHATGIRSFLSLTPPHGDVSSMSRFGPPMFFSPPLVDQDASVPHPEERRVSAIALSLSLPPSLGGVGGSDFVGGSSRGYDQTRMMSFLHDVEECLREGPTPPPELKDLQKTDVQMVGGVVAPGGTLPTLQEKSESHPKSYPSASPTDVSPRSSQASWEEKLAIISSTERRARAEKGYQVSPDSPVPVAAPLLAISDYGLVDDRSADSEAPRREGGLDARRATGNGTGGDPEQVVTNGKERRIEKDSKKKGLGERRGVDILVVDPRQTDRARRSSGGSRRSDGSKKGTEKETGGDGSSGGGRGGLFQGLFGPMKKRPLKSAGPNSSAASVILAPAFGGRSSGSKDKKATVSCDQTAYPEPQLRGRSLSFGVSPPGNTLQQSETSESGTAALDSPPAHLRKTQSSSSSNQTSTLCAAGGVVTVRTKSEGTGSVGGSSLRAGSSSSNRSTAMPPRGRSSSGCYSLDFGAVLPVLPVATLQADSSGSHRGVRYSGSRDVRATPNARPMTVTSPNTSTAAPATGSSRLHKKSYPGKPSTGPLRTVSAHSYTHSANSTHSAHSPHPPSSLTSPSLTSPSQPPSPSPGPSSPVLMYRPRSYSTDPDARAGSRKQARWY
eukprot:Rmarinus@m.23352